MVFSFFVPYLSGVMGIFPFWNQPLTENCRSIVPQSFMTKNHTSEWDIYVANQPIPFAISTTWLLLLFVHTIRVRHDSRYDTYYVRRQCSLSTNLSKKILYMLPWYLLVKHGRDIDCPRRYILYRQSYVWSTSLARSKNIQLWTQFSPEIHGKKRFWKKIWNRHIFIEYS